MYIFMYNYAILYQHWGNHYDTIKYEIIGSFLKLKSFCNSMYLTSVFLMTYFNHFLYCKILFVLVIRCLLCQCLM